MSRIRLAWVNYLSGLDIALNDNCKVNMLFELATTFAGRRIKTVRKNGLVDLDEIEKIFVAHGLVKFRHHTKIVKGKHIDTWSIFSADWAVLNLQKNSYDDAYDLMIMDASDDNYYVKLFEDKLLDMFSPTKDKKGSIFALMVNDGSLELASLGQMKEPLVRDNYVSTVVADYDHIISCLASEQPCGRIALLDGPPGTGKSFMIRSLIHDAKGIHIIIPGSCVDQLSSPNFLTILHGAHEPGKPIVLIIEDADMVVANRNAGNLRVLSDVLNIGDGLLGQMLDIRVVASTNASRLQMDAAITRPGRMCRHVTIGDFDQDHAQKVWNRLTEGKGGELKKGIYTLAELYRMSRGDEWQKKEKKKYEGGNYA